MTETPPAGAHICFIDTESTSLAVPWAAHGRRVWEFAGIRVDGQGRVVTRLHLIISDVSLADATPKALDVGGFYSRHPTGGGKIPPGAWPVTEARAAALIAEFTAGGPWLCGANVAFDEANVADMLVRHRLVDPTARDPFPWYHHTYDVLAYAAGYLGLLPPWGSDSIAVAAGVPRDAAGPAHEAMSDAGWCLLVHRRVCDPARRSVTALMDAVQSQPA